MTESASHNARSGLSKGHRFMSLYVANERRLRGFIYTLSHDWQATEDILQETAKVMWSKFAEFQPGTDFIAWSFCIAKYQFLNHLKTWDTRTLFNSAVLKQLEEELYDFAKDDHRRQEALRVCLQKLNKRDRRLIELRYEIGATVKDIAQRVDRGIKGVYYSLNRIHIQLFKCIRHRLVLEEEA